MLLYHCYFSNTSHPSTFYLIFVPNQSIQHSVNQTEANRKLTGRYKVALETFVEKLTFLWLLQEWIKWYKGYQMFSAILFVLRPVMIVILRNLCASFLLQCIILAIALFIGVSLLIAYIKPYRKSYMNLLDTILLLYTAFLCSLTSASFKRSTVFIATCEILLFTAPLIIFLHHVIVTSVIKIKFPNYVWLKLHWGLEIFFPV